MAQERHQACERDRIAQQSYRNWVMVLDNKPGCDELGAIGDARKGRRYSRKPGCGSEDRHDVATLGSLG